MLHLFNMLMNNLSLHYFSTCVLVCLCCISIILMFIHKWFSGSLPRNGISAHNEGHQGEPRFEFNLLRWYFLYYTLQINQGKENSVTINLLLKPLLQKKICYSHHLQPGFHVQEYDSGRTKDLLFT